MPEKLVILIPAYNEEQRIEPVLRSYAAYFREHYAAPFEIVVILNGCRDNTLGRVRRAAEIFPEIRWTVFDAPIGKGGALIEGLKLAPQAGLIGFTDADGATSPASFLELVQRCREADCVVGSRRVEGAVIRQAQPTRRMFASRVFHLIVELLFWMRIKDTQCGAKVLRREAAMRIQNALHIADMAFDINLLYCLRRERFRVVEFPVEWTDHIGTKVRYFRTSLVMLLSVLRLRVIHSPLHFLLCWLRPVEVWIYRALHNPPPRATPSHDVPAVHRIEDRDGTVSPADAVR